MGPTLIIPLGILAAISAILGEKFGAGDGWSVFISVVAAAVALGWWHHLYRQARQQSEQDLAQYRVSEFQAIDVMSGTQFEDYCAWLLGVVGYKNVRRIGSTTDEDGIDILADSPGGSPVAVQCKRQKRSVRPDVVRAVHGAVGAGRHAGRVGILMTNAKVMPKGKEFAGQSGVRVIDRIVLGELLKEARRRIDKQAAAPEGSVPGSTAELTEQQHVKRLSNGLRDLRPESKVAAVVVGCAVAVIGGTVIQMAVTGPRHAAAAVIAPQPAPVAASSRAPKPPGPPAPEAVIRQFYASISSHDWPEVWRLGGRNLGTGPYASYGGMVSGYRGTVRDVLTELHARGDRVSGRFLAYQASGAVLVYQFSYVVHDGAIISGHQAQL